MNKGKYIVSDDTVMHLAIADCLIETRELKPGEKVWKTLVGHYKNAMLDMLGRDYLINLFI